MVEQDALTMPVCMLSNLTPIEVGSAARDGAVVSWTASSHGMGLGRPYA